MPTVDMVLEEIWLEEESPQELLQDLVRAYEAFGVTVRLTGKLPERRTVALAFVEVLREAATNAICHGHADVIEVKVGEVGIRIENELVCVHKADNQYGTFLDFEPLMFVPIATSPILPGVLDKDEIAWLNDYHRQVFAKLAPHLNDEERSWLAEKCAAIGC